MGSHWASCKAPGAVVSHTLTTTPPLAAWAAVSFADTAAVLAPVLDIMPALTQLVSAVGSFAFTARVAQSQTCIVAQ